MARRPSKGFWKNRIQVKSIRKYISHYLPSPYFIPLSDSEMVCVILKCIAGAHLGQKFRLEPASVIICNKILQCRIMWSHGIRKKTSLKWVDQRESISERKGLVCTRTKRFQQLMRRYVKVHRNNDDLSFPIYFRGRWK